MKKIIYIKQNDLRDCGVACLTSIINYYGGYVRREYLREITKTTSLGVSAESLLLAGNEIGFDTLGVKGKIDDYKNDFPLIAHVLINNKIGHFVVIIKMDKKHIVIMDPSQGIKKITKDEFMNMSTNVYLLFKPRSEILTQDAEKSFFKIIYPIIIKYKSIILILLLFSIIYSILNILVSYQFNFFINMIVLKNKFGIDIIFYFLILVIFIKELSNYFRNKLINYLNHSLDLILIKDVYNHLIRLPYLYFKNRKTGDILTRINDITNIKEVISKLFVTITIDLILIIFVILMMFKINSNLTLICLLTAFLYSLIIFIYNIIITKKLKKIKTYESNLNSYLVESLSSINTIKSMQIENITYNNLKNKYEKFNNSSFKMLNIFYQETFFKDLIYGIGMLVIIYLGIIKVLNNQLELADLITFNSLMIYYFTPIQNIFNIQILFKEASLSFSRIKELLNIKKEVLVKDKKSINKRLLGNILISNLSYSYDGIKDVLACKKILINASDKVLLYGNSGGGKSTLMKLLCRYLDRYEGNIYLDNKKITEYNLLDIRSKITYVSQDETLYTDTIYNNITLQKECSYDKYLEIIKLVKVDEIIDKCFLKHDSLIEFNASNFSGGERQRIILARTLMKDSDIYIFDESLNALDVKTERIILKNIFNYLKNKTVIVISHRFNNRDLYKRFILIEKGVIYEC